MENETLKYYKKFKKSFHVKINDKRYEKNVYRILYLTLMGMFKKQILLAFGLSLLSDLCGLFYYFLLGTFIQLLSGVDQDNY